jgi:hypothetical protein
MSFVCLCQDPGRVAKAPNTPKKRPRDAESITWAAAETGLPSWQERARLLTRE